MRTIIAFIAACFTIQAWADTAAAEQSKQPAEKPAITKQDKEHAADKLYNSIKSGWNDMLDVVAPPDQPAKKQ